MPGGPPAVYGELPAPGATRTLVLYAHYDGQPSTRSSGPRRPGRRCCATRNLLVGGKIIPIPAGSGRVDPESRIYGRSAGDDKASIMAILAAVDAMRASKTAQSVNLKVFFEGEEEAGSAHLRQILEKYAPVLAGDAWLFCDGPVHQSGRQQLVFGNRGITTASSSPCTGRRARCTAGTMATGRPIPACCWRISSRACATTTGTSRSPATTTT